MTLRRTHDQALKLAHLPLLVQDDEVWVESGIALHGAVLPEEYAVSACADGDGQSLAENLLVPEDTVPYRCSSDGGL